MDESLGPTSAFQPSSLCRHRRAQHYKLSSRHELEQREARDPQNGADSEHR